MEEVRRPRERGEPEERARDHGGAAAALLAMHRRHGWIAALLVGAFAAVWAAIAWADSLPYVSYGDFVGKMSEKGGKVEVMREAGGLTIVAVWLAVVAMVGWRRDRGV